MSMLSRRLQVLIDEDRYNRLSRHALAQGMSIATLVRNAIDTTYPAVDPARARAARAVLEAEPMPLPDDPEEFEREVREAHEKRAVGA